MRLRSLLSCALLGLAAALVPASSASAVGVTPGTYVNYTFDTASVTQAEFRMTVNASPGKANVYWANQFGFTAADVGGYTGMQTHRDGVGMFIYSLIRSGTPRPGGSATPAPTASSSRRTAPVAVAVSTNRRSPGTPTRSRWPVRAAAGTA